MRAALVAFSSALIRSFLGGDRLAFGSLVSTSNRLLAEEAEIETDAPLLLSFEIDNRSFQEIGCVILSHF